MATDKAASAIAWPHFSEEDSVQAERRERRLRELFKKLATNERLQQSLERERERERTREIRERIRGLIRQ